MFLTFSIIPTGRNLFNNNWFHKQKINLGIMSHNIQELHPLQFAIAIIPASYWKTTLRINPFSWLFRKAQRPLPLHIPKRVVNALSYFIKLAFDSIQMDREPNVWAARSKSSSNDDRDCEIYELTTTPPRRCEQKGASDWKRFPIREASESLSYKRNLAKHIFEFLACLDGFFHPTLKDFCSYFKVRFSHRIIFRSEKWMLFKANSHEAMISCGFGKDSCNVSQWRWRPL